MEELEMNEDTYERFQLVKEIIGASTDDETLKFLIYLFNLKRA